MTAEIEQLYSEYVAWLRDKTRFRRTDEAWTEITTPYLDRHNDYVQLYAKPVNGDFLITDDGHTIADLELSGCSLDSPKRRALLTTTLNGFGVRTDGDQLTVRATQRTAPQKMHDLIQAVLAVNDLFFLASPTVASLFVEDVQAWLDESDIRYTPDVRFTGKGGFGHFGTTKSHDDRQDSPEQFRERFANPYIAAERGWVDAIIEPRDTRPKLIAALRQPETKRDTNPPKKHGNIPL